MSAIRNLSAAACVAAALVLSPGSAPAQAPDPEAVALARELMQVTLVDQLQKQMVDQSWTQMEALIRQSAPQITPEQLADLKSEFAAIAEKDIAAATAGAPAMYARYFSKEELKDLVAFYGTPTGKKTVAVMPALMGEMMQALTPQMLDSAKRMQEAFARVLKREGIDLPAGPR